MSHNTKTIMHLPPQETFVIFLKSNEVMCKSEKNYVTRIQGGKGGTSILTYVFM